MGQIRVLKYLSRKNFFNKKGQKMFYSFLGGGGLVTLVDPPLLYNSFQQPNILLLTSNPAPTPHTRTHKHKHIHTRAHTRARARTPTYIDTQSELN